MTQRTCSASRSAGSRQLSGQACLGFPLAARQLLLGRPLGPIHLLAQHVALVLVLRRLLLDLQQTCNAVFSGTPGFKGTSHWFAKAF